MTLSLNIVISTVTMLNEKLYQPEGGGLLRRGDGNRSGNRLREMAIHETLQTKVSHFVVITDLQKVLEFVIRLDKLLVLWIDTLIVLNVPDQVLSHLSPRDLRALFPIHEQSQIIAYVRRLGETRGLARGPRLLLIRFPLIRLEFLSERLFKNANLALNGRDLSAETSEGLQNSLDLTGQRTRVSLYGRGRRRAIGRHLLRT